MNIHIKSTDTRHHNILSPRQARKLARHKNHGARVCVVNERPVVVLDKYGKFV